MKQKTYVFFIVLIIFAILSNNVVLAQTDFKIGNLFYAITTTQYSTTPYNKVIEISKGYNLTLNNGTNLSTSSMNFDGIDDVVSLSESNDLNRTNFTLMIWVNVTANPTIPQYFIGKKRQQDNNYAIYLGSVSDGKLSFEMFDGTLNPNSRTSFSITANTTFMAVATKNGTNLQVHYCDTSNFYSAGSVTSSSVNPTYANDLRIGAHYQNTFFLKGNVFSAGYWNYAMTSSQIQELCSKGRYFNPYAPTNLTIYANDINNNALTNFSVIVNGTTRHTSNGSIVTNIIKGTGLVNISFIGANNTFGAFFNRSYLNINTSNDFTGILHQAEVRFNASDVFGRLVNGSFFINNTLMNSTNLMVAQNNVNVTFSNSSWSIYNASRVFNVTPLFNGTIQVFDAYQGLLNFSVRNAFTNNLLNNWTGNITNTNLNLSFNYNQTNNPLRLVFGNYSVYLEVPSYSISSDNFKNITFNLSLQQINFSLYTSNSIFIFVRNEEDNSLITENITAVMTSSLGDTTFYITNGSRFLEYLQDGNYIFKFSNNNYTLRTYYVSVADRSTQTLTALLSRVASSTTFTVVDDLTSNTIEGASITMYRLFNNSWSVIESKNSDITGRSQFYYTPNVRYKFVVSKSGYLTKEFELNPVLFSSYNIRLDRVSQAFNQQTQVISVDYTPKNFFDNSTTPFNIYFRTSEGAFIYYNFTLTLPNGSKLTGAGNQSQGQGFSLNITINNAKYKDYVNLTYFYNSTIAGSSSIFIRIPVFNGTNTNTFIYNIKENYGLGIFERALIATLIIAIAGGVATFIAGSFAGIGLGLLLTGYFAYISFIPFWAAIIVLFVGFLFISKRGSE